MKLSTYSKSTQNEQKQTSAGRWITGPLPIIAHTKCTIPKASHPALGSRSKATTGQSTKQHKIPECERGHEK